MNNRDLLSRARILIQELTFDNEKNAAHISRILPPKLARRLGKAEFTREDVSKYLNGAAEIGISPDTLDINIHAQEPEQRLKEILECDHKNDVVARWVAEREEQKLGETCEACGKSARDLGKKVMLKCSACTLAPLYCGSECQKAAWPAHKAACKANRKASK